jgi:hypothetical protein
MGVPVNGLGQTKGTELGQQGTLSDVGRPADSLLEKNSTLEKNSAPSWLREIQSDSTPGLPQTPQAGQGFSAGSLLDANAMPGWMREGAQRGPQTQQPAAGQSMAAGSLLDANAMPGWMREGAQGGPQTQQPVAGQSMAAGSLIDVNAMPAWMRNADNSQPGISGGRPGQVPARPVPSRPRGDNAPQEQSEAAANAFSAMLFAAASAPILPGQEPVPAPAPASNLGVAQGPSAQPVPPYQQQPSQPPVIPGWQQPAMNPYMQGGSGPGWQISSVGPAPAPQPQYGQGPLPGPYAPMGQPGSAGNMYPGNMYPGAIPPEPPPWTGSSAADRTALGVTSGAPSSSNQSQTLAPENRKKGFFDSIRDFFSR